MRRVLLAVPLLLLPACAETPSGLPSNVQPQLTTAVGSSATWSFQATAYYVLAGDAVAVGDQLTGKMQFTVTGPGSYPQACWYQYPGTASVNYTVKGEPYSQSGWAGLNLIQSCWPYTSVPLLQISAQYWLLQMPMTADTEDFPLLPPTASENAVLDLSIPQLGSHFFAQVTSMKADPGSKQACKNDGWKSFGFRNQGLCVSYVETGKDTR